MYHFNKNEGKWLYEEYMDLIDIDSIKITQNRKTTIHFTDELIFTTLINLKHIAKRFITKEKTKL